MKGINNWKNFELLATKYLKENYEEYAFFEKQGGEDSTTPDILVKTKREEFYIEAKSSKAQSGQFVVLPNFEKKCFEFSKKNKTKENELTKVIVNFMNEKWEMYSTVSTNSLKIDMSDSVFASWITSYYKEKNVKFFISGTTKKFIIIPINNFSESFDVTANYRKKGSGTRPLPKKYLTDVAHYFKNLNENSSVIKKDKHFYLNTNEDLDKKYFKMKGKEEITVYLSKDDNYKNGYRISVKSNTKNPNVIFSIKLKSGISGIDKESFINQLLILGQND